MTLATAPTVRGALQRRPELRGHPLLSCEDLRTLERIEAKVEAGSRLDFEEGLFLFRTPAIHRVGSLANRVRETRHGDRAYFVLNRHLNPSNYCVYSCSFCAFAKKPGDPEAYRMSLEEVQKLVAEQFEPDLSEVHIVGGIDPKLPYSYFIDLLRVIKAVRPSLHLKAYTMIEIEWLSRIGRKPVDAVLDDLLEAGLGSCPGGGVEVLSDRVHEALFPGKLGPDQWLETARRVQQRGIRMNATMLYGHIESDEELVRHMVRIRDLQDETGGFLTFIPLAFHPANTELSHLPGPTGVLDLRTIAVSRLMLDNIDHVKTYWIMQGLGIAEVALDYGADDIDGTVVQERITHAAGARSPLGVNREELIRLIRNASRIPVERDTLYEKLVPIDPVGAADYNELRERAQ